MEDATTVTSRPKASESTLCNVSMRGWLVLIIIGSASYMAIRQITIVEPYYSLVMLAAGFYFGQVSRPKTHGANP